jgi:hypothetical protein
MYLRPPQEPGTTLDPTPDRNSGGLVFSPSTVSPSVVAPRLRDSATGEFASLELINHKAMIGTLIPFVRSTLLQTEAF